MEYLDIVNEKGLPVGECVSREKAHKEGILHRTAHVWVIKPKNDGVDVLLQKRSENSESFPGMYDTSSAGHILAGDEPKQSALRELLEELGISAAEDRLEFIGTFHNKYEEPFHGEMFRDNEITWVYLFSDPVDISTLSLQEEEVSEVKWFDLEEVWNGICNNDERFCVPKQGLEVLRDHVYKRNAEK